MKLDSLTPALLDRVLDAAITLQAIPAPTFAEAERAGYVREQFVQAGLHDVEIDAAGNVLGRRPGRAGGRAHPVVVSAHTDSVFPAGTDLALQRLTRPDRLAGPGIGDNALGVAGLLGLAWLLDAAGTETPGDLWLAANTGEEGLGDLCGMRTVLARFGTRAAAYVVLEGMALGHIYHRAIGVRRCRITARSAGGHSWLHFGRPSAIHALVRLAATLADWSLPAAPRTTLNIGMIAGGVSVNTIAPEANLLLDLRSEDPAALRTLARRVEAACREADDEQGVTIACEVIGERPAGAIPREHPLVQLAARSLAACGVKDISFENGSTDANAPLSQGLPCVCIGLTRGGHAHRADEYIEVEPLGMGLQQLGLIVLGAYEL
jgi:tripeptide aminopeptidase